MTTLGVTSWTLLKRGLYGACGVLGLADAFMCGANFAAHGSTPLLFVSALAAVLTLWVFAFAWYVEGRTG